MVKHIAEIAASLNLVTIVEFVEDAETLELLADYGIDAVQGFHVGRPEPAHAIERLVVPEGASEPDPATDPSDRRKDPI